MMYQKVIEEMKKRMEAKESRYRELKEKRQQELMDLAREMDLQMDRRRRRKKQTS